MLVSHLHSLGEKVKNFFLVSSKRKKIGLGFLMFFVIIGTVFWVSPTYAQSVATGFGNSLLEALSQFFLVIARLCIGLTVFSLKMFIEVANYNGYIDAPTVVVGWVMLRDVANMFFVVVLLVIAFGTILGIEQYEWKRALGKLVFAAVFINFSKMICGLIIDIAHVFTITFLNAVSAAAGGNLINMFKLNQLMTMIGKDYSTSTDLALEIMGASILAMVFAVFAMMIMGAYAVMMTVRLVALWVLIVMSPLAFILQVIPSTEGYAREWWDKFTKEVLVAPVMVFFLWLAFATLGSGNITQTLGIQIDSAEANAVVTQGTFNGKSLSISEVSSWENMANFFIAIAFLTVGFAVVMRLGAVGAGMVGGAIDLAKKAALYGAGYYVAKAAVGAGVKGAVGGAKYVGNRVPVLGGAAMREYGAGISSIYKRKGLLGFVGKSGLGGYESAMRRSEWAKKQEGKGVLGWIAARAWEPTERAEKRATDWKETTERAKKILEESYSTSSSKAGQAKLKTTVELKRTEAFSEAKKEEKMLKEMERVARESPDLTGMSEDQRKAVLKQMKKEDFMAGQALERTVETAKIGQNVKELKRGDEVRRAEHEALALREKGKEAKAASIIKAVYQKQFKEDQEEFANMEFTERVNQAKIISEKLVTPGISEEAKKNLRKDAMKLLTIAANSSEEEFTAMMDGMVTKVYGGVQQELNSDNAGQRILEAVTGRRITNYDEFNSAHQLLEGSATFRDTGESQAVLSSFGAAIKRGAGKQGGVRYVGAVIEDDPQENENAGRAVADKAPVGYRFAANSSIAAGAPPHAPINRDISKKADLEKYFQPRVDLRTATNLHGYMGVKGDKVVSISNTQREGLVNVLSQFGDERSVAQGFSSTIADGNDIAKFDPPARAEMITMLNNVRSNYSDPSLQPVFDKLMKTQFPTWIGNGVNLYRPNP